MLLGANTPVPERYDPGILYAIPRADGRSRLGLDGEVVFHGVDVWHAYELSWLRSDGRPVARVGRFDIPATSVNIVESKSLKLYLNSLNSHVFDNDRAAVDTIQADVTAATGCNVSLALFAADDSSLAGQALPGYCIDDTPPGALRASPSADILQVADNGTATDQAITCYSHLLRSLCPVTGQPDWATVWLDYRGPAIDTGSLLAYILSFREHQEFHEQCVERIFTDIWRRAAPSHLTVQALYTRRGGLDICPLRSSDPAAAPLPRLDRQ